MRKTNTYSPFGSLFTTVTAMVSPAHETITRQPLYDTIPPLALRPPVRSLLSRAFYQVALWQMRRTQRRTLAVLSDRLLRDVGLSRQRGGHRGGQAVLAGVSFSLGQLRRRRP